MGSFVFFLLLLFLYWVTGGNGGILWLIIISLGLIGWIIHKNLDGINKILDWIAADSRRHFFFTHIFIFWVVIAVIMSGIGQMFDLPFAWIWITVPVAIAACAWVSKDQ